jgi:hypothetical protein
MGCKFGIEDQGVCNNLETGKAGLGPERARDVIPARPNALPCEQAGQTRWRQTRV